MPPKKRASPSQTLSGEVDAGSGPSTVPSRIVDDPFAPEYHIDEVQSVSLVNGLICAAFATGRYDYSAGAPVLKRVVTLRLVIPVQGAQGLAVELYNFLDRNHLAVSAPVSIEPTEGAQAPAPANPADLVENLLAPELFASASRAMINLAGMVGITFVSGRSVFGASGMEYCEVVNGRLILPAATARNFTTQLYGFLSHTGMGLKPADGSAIQ